MRFLLVAACSLSCTLAVGQVDKSPKTTKPSTHTALLATTQPQTYGASVTPAGAVPVQQLQTVLAGRDSARVKLVGPIADVCKAEGCWLTMQPAPGQMMRVRFKDHAFFVPKDISGKTAVIEGVVVHETVSVAQQRHYAEDAGKSKQEIAAITKPVEQYNFIADGVRVQ
ncbi:DUF4920 domain-containing protein [Hymenobacter sp. NBH84]|nr:DUF4920 domain-containing protein [Hymenobacter sp. NBH84]